jgi:phosphoribosylformylglycinamidine cyclo-ligase
MMRTFNNGIGFIAVVHEKDAQEVLDCLIAMKEKVFVIGEVVERKQADERVQWV